MAEKGTANAPGGSSTHEEGERSPFASRWFISAAVFLVVVAMLGAWVVGSHVLGGRKAGRASASAPPAVSSSATDGAQDAPVPDDDASVCGLAAGDQQVPAAALQGRVTTAAPGVEVPVVDDIGPGVEDGITRCFAHSPTGAVVAAANWMKWFSSKQQLPDVITTLMAEGPQRDRLARQVDDGWDGATTGAATVHGYKVDVRSNDEVVVTLAVSVGQSKDEGLASWPVLLRWEQGDWKIVVPENAAWGQEPVESVALGGFTEWSV